MIYSSGTTSTGAVMEECGTLTIMQDGLKHNDLTPAGGSAHDLLGEDDYLESITFSDVTARADESWNITFLIDSITINLKQK